MSELIAERQSHEETKEQCRKLVAAMDAQLLYERQQRKGLEFKLMERMQAEKITGAKQKRESSQDVASQGKPDMEIPTRPTSPHRVQSPKVGTHMEDMERHSQTRKEAQKMQQKIQSLEQELNSVQDQLRSANQLVQDKDLVILSQGRDIKELQRLIAEVEQTKRELEKARATELKAMRRPASSYRPSPATSELAERAQLIRQESNIVMEIQESHRREKQTLSKRYESDLLLAREKVINTI